MNNEEKENTTVHTASRAMYERLVKKLIKTNSVFSVDAVVPDATKDMPTSSYHVLIHPFCCDARVEFYHMAYKAESAARANSEEVRWSVTIHEGSKAAYDLLHLFNRTLTLCDNPTAEL